MLGVRWHSSSEPLDQVMSKLPLELSPEGYRAQLQVLRFNAQSLRLPSMQSKRHLVEAVVADVVWRYADRLGAHPGRDSHGVGSFV